MTWLRRIHGICPRRFAASLAASVSLGAIYARVDIEDVPVARLVANLEKELAANPKSPEIHLRLARLHAMAYSRTPRAARHRPRRRRPETASGSLARPRPDLIPRKVAPEASRSDASKAFLAKWSSTMHARPAGYRRTDRTDRLRMDP